MAGFTFEVESDYRDSTVVEYETHNEGYGIRGGMKLHAHEGVLHITSFGHCSCNGSWEDGSVVAEWSGDRRALKRLAKGRFDHNIPTQPLNPSMREMDHWENFYNECLAWLDKTARKRN